MTAEEVATLFGITRVALNGVVRRGLLRPKKLGKNCVFDTRQLVALFEAGQNSLESVLVERDPH